MKKAIGIIVCIMALLGGRAMSEAEYRKGWEARLDDIAVSYKDQTVCLQPSLRLRISMPDDLSAVQAALEVWEDDGPLGGIWIEEDGAARLAFSNSESCTVMREGALLHLLVLQEYVGMDLSSDEAFSHYSSLPNVLSEMNEALADTRAIEALLGMFGKAEREGNALRCTIRPDETTQIQFVFSMKDEENMGPLFDLSGKTEAAMNAREGFFGSDHMMKASQELLSSLMQEETIAELFTLLGDFPS